MSLQVLSRMIQNWMKFMLIVEKKNWCILHHNMYYNEILSWLIGIWIKNRLVGDCNCNIVNQ